jgi:hypothetical protein
LSAVCTTATVGQASPFGVFYWNSNYAQLSPFSITLAFAGTNNYWQLQAGPGYANIIFQTTASPAPVGGNSGAGNFFITIVQL